MPNTKVSDVNFNTYWHEISGALVGLSNYLGLPNPSGDIAHLKTCSLDEDRRIFLFLRNIAIPVLCLLLPLLSVYFKNDYPPLKNISNPSFVGREWVFQELAVISYTRDVRGIHLVADPGWGKSAVMNQLINSPLSSVVIHENIIGHHFCKYNEKSTRDADQFVKSLAESIAQKISDFRVQLESNCKLNLTECFHKVIVDPLQKLNATGRNVSFVLIDALDECLEKEERNNSMILNILYSSVPNLPNWIKLIVTSRKLALTTSIVSKIDKFFTLEIEAEDKRNEQDLRTYAIERIFAQTFFTKMPIEENLHLSNLIDLALKSSKGNFLFFETIIKHWQKYPHRRNAKSIPESLTDIYVMSFEKRFNVSAFDDFEPFLEVLLAANSPPTLSKLEKILYIYNKTYDTRKIAQKLSEFFKSDINKEPLEFHHQFLAEWLTNQTNGTYGIFIKKSRGHQYIVNYLFHFYSVNGRLTNLTLRELSELCIHILRAGEKEIDANLRNLNYFNVSEVRDLLNSSILHDIAPIKDATKIIAALIEQFNFIDILDHLGQTPAMYAVKAGNFENVNLFIDSGADVNHTVEIYLYCHYWNFVLKPSYNPTLDYSMSPMAAFEGYTKIAKLLVTSGSEIGKADQCGWKPLYLAVVMGHFEIVQLYVNNGAQADEIALHHATARNHSEIVRYLLNAGVRDTCLPCKSGNLSWCSVHLIRLHHCFCETALYAAVSRDNTEIAELILEYGKASVNCKHGSGRTPLMEAFSQKNTQMIKLLLSAGANIDAECEIDSNLIIFFHQCSRVDKEEDALLYTRYCGKAVCNGYRIIDFSFAHGLSRMIIPLMSKERLNASSTVAAIYDNVDFISVTYGNGINSIPHIKTILRYVAVCHSVKTLKHLLNSRDLSKQLTSVYEDGKTLLHFATLGSSEPKTEDFVTQSCASSACVCPNKLRADIVDHSLETVMLLTNVSEINKQDKYGRTAVHYAAVHALAKTVEYLLNAGADWSITDGEGDTALEFALRERPVGTKAFLPCRSTSDSVFQVCQSTLFDEMASYLLQNAAIKKCDKRAKKLLDGFMRHRIPLSLYELFKSGLDVNCARQHFKRFLNELASTPWWLRKEHEEILEVFKIFEINVDVTCNVPCIYSELHLMAYLRTTSDSAQVGNLFKPSYNGNSFPLERFNASHPKSVDIFNECYDKEGYLAIHRAVEGRNFDAVCWFIEIGVDVLRKTKFGSTALALAAHFFPKPRLMSLYPENRRIFEKLLEITKEKSHAGLYCNIKRVDLSPLHFAGNRGTEILEIIHRKMPELPLDCTNSDRIRPVYLAYLYYATNIYLSEEDKQAFQNLGLSPDTPPSQFPQREAEYHLIYNQFYRTPKVDLRSILNHEPLFECPGINELLPHKKEIEGYVKLKRCTTRCWQFAFEASRDFSSNFPYMEIQNNISNPFTDKFIDIAAHMAELRFNLVKMFHFSSYSFLSISSLAKQLWRKVTKAHSCAHSCSCFETMLLLQETFTGRRPTSYKKVGEFVAERMGWVDTARKGDVLYRWPFSFLLKKALRTDKAYEYLENLSPPDSRSI